MSVKAKIESARVRVPMSKTRRSYIFRLVLRFLILAACVTYFVFVNFVKPAWMPDWAKNWFDCIKGVNFFDFFTNIKQFSPVHILWGIWMVCMIMQLIPSKHVPLGSHKHMKERFKQVSEVINFKSLKEYINNSTKSAYIVFVIWLAFDILLGILLHTGVISAEMVFLISVAFYVCDLICVLIWCPFRLLLKTRCCTTCRIFNWDHMMMFTPMLFINSFFSVSLIVMAFIVWIVWEVRIMMHPERFWENSNDALKCANCTDKLCTQYCQKLKRK